jgi:hypothetical protein
VSPTLFIGFHVVHILLVESLNKRENVLFLLVLIVVFLSLKLFIFLLKLKISKEENQDIMLIFFFGSDPYTHNAQQ